MDYREYAPHPSLQRIVRCYWTLSVPQNAPDPPAPALPDGCPELILNFASPICAATPTGTVGTQPAIMLVGQVAGPKLRSAAAISIKRTSSAILASSAVVPPRACWPDSPSSREPSRPWRLKGQPPEGSDPPFSMAFADAVPHVERLRGGPPLLSSISMGLARHKTLA